MLSKYLKKYRIFASKIIICEIYFKLIKEKDNTLAYDKFYKIKKNSFLIKIPAHADLYYIFENVYTQNLINAKHKDFDTFQKQLNIILDNYYINNNLITSLNIYKLEIQNC